MVLTIECDGEQTKSTFHAEDLVDNSVLRSSPAYERKVAQGREDEVGKPIIAEANAKCDQKEGVSRHAALVPTSCQINTYF